MKKFHFLLAIAIAGTNSFIYAAQDANTSPKMQLATSVYINCNSHYLQGEKLRQQEYMKYLRHRYSMFDQQKTKVQQVIQTLAKRNAEHSKMSAAYMKSAWISYFAKNIPLTDLQQLDRYCKMPGAKLTKHYVKQGYQQIMQGYYAYSDKLSDQDSVLDGKYFEELSKNSGSQKYLKIMGVVNINKFADLLNQATVSKDPTAVYNMSIVYKDGKWGVKKNTKASFYWLQKAYKLGVTDAVNNLAIYYDEGIGVKKNTKKAIELFKQAAKLGDGYAMYNIGLDYFKPKKGQAQNYAKALGWYHKAAAQGVSCAMHDLGTMYLNGYGVTKNKAEARKWFTQSIPAGVTEDVISIDKLNGDFSNDLLTLSRYYAQFMVGGNKNLPVFKNARLIEQQFQKACWE
jgi:TPR repeat protein